MAFTLFSFSFSFRFIYEFAGMVASHIKVRRTFTSFRFAKKRYGLHNYLDFVGFAAGNNRHRAVAPFSGRAPMHDSWMVGFASVPHTYRSRQPTTSHGNMRRCEQKAYNFIRVLL
jgi:hypothetical protein